MTVEHAEQDVVTAGHRRKPVTNVLTLGVLLAYATISFTPEKLVAAIMLSLSVGVDFFVMQDQKPNSHLSSTLAWCEWAKIFFLVLYVFEGHQLPEGIWRAASITALLWALFLVAMMLLIAAEMIRTANGSPPRQRRFAGSSLGELLTDKVLALTGAVIAFLHVTYALTFALALSDHYDKSDLWAVRYAEPAETKTADVPAPLSGRVYKFFFDESAATMPCTAAFRLAMSNNTDLQRAVSDALLEARIPAFDGVGAADCGTGPAAMKTRRAAAWNVRELYDLSVIFRRLAAGQGKSYLVEIRGHANDRRLMADPSLRYGSNYEISKQRADQISLLLANEFRQAAPRVEEPPIRWLPYGISNESSFLEADPKQWLPSGLEPKLSAEVRIQPITPSFEDVHLQTTRAELRAARLQRRSLELTDYLYFTVYTITTTGYGDIIPVSSYAKLIVTLANLIELLFIVVLVNVIATARLEGADDEKTT